MGVIEEDTSQETGYPNNAESFANTYPGWVMYLTVVISQTYLF